METVESALGSNVVVLWLDDHICKRDNCEVLKTEFRKNARVLLTFHSIDDCRRCLPQLKDRQMFCIIQGKYARDIVPDIIKNSHPSRLPFVYVFCLNMVHLVDWADEQPCVKNGGMFDHEQDLLGKLTKDLAEFVTIKAMEYSLKRTACDEWATELAAEAKRKRYEKCTLPYADNPFSDKDKSGEEARELQ